MHVPVCDKLLLSFSLVFYCTSRTLREDGDALYKSKFYLLTYFLLTTKGTRNENKHHNNLHCSLCLLALRLDLHFLYYPTFSAVSFSVALFFY